MSKLKINLSLTFTDEVYKLLESPPANLQRIPLRGGSFVFASHDLKKNEDKMMILIHGAGVVRAGQWSR